MQYIGFNIEDEKLEKLKIISFITKKNRTELIKEGLEIIIDKYSDSFEKFQKHIKDMKK